MLWRPRTNQPRHLCSMVIYRVLHPSSKPIHTDPDKHYLTKTTEWTLGLIPDKVTDLFSLIELLPNLVSCPPKLCTLSRNKVLKVISQLWLDCFTGVGQTVTTVILIKITCMYLIYRCWQFHHRFLKIYMLPLKLLKSQIWSIYGCKETIHLLLTTYHQDIMTYYFSQGIT